MAKQSGQKGMHGGSDKKTRGRTSISFQGGGRDMGPTPSKPNAPQELRTEANRPISAGGGKKRGDRRDMSKTYTGNAKHKARGNNPRVDVKTRKR